MVRPFNLPIMGQRINEPSKASEWIPLLKFVVKVAVAALVAVYLSNSFTRLTLKVEKLELSIAP